jgi:hypothetical protein
MQNVSHLPPALVTDADITEPTDIPALTADQSGVQLMEPDHDEVTQINILCDWLRTSPGINHSEDPIFLLTPGMRVRPTIPLQINT